MVHSIGAKLHGKIQFLILKPVINYLAPVEANVTDETVLTRFYTELLIQTKSTYLSDLTLHIIYKTPSLIEEAQSSSVSGSALLDVAVACPSVCDW